MLEVSGKKNHGKSLRIPHNKAVVPSTPWNNMICGRVLDDVIGFGKKRRRARFMNSLQRLRRLNHGWGRCARKRWACSSKRYLHSALRIHDLPTKRINCDLGLIWFLVPNHYICRWNKKQCSWTSTSQGKLFIDHKIVFLPNGVLGMKVENDSNSEKKERFDLYIRRHQNI